MSLLLALGGASSTDNIEWYLQWDEEDLEQYDEWDGITAAVNILPLLIQTKHRGFLVNVGELLK